MDSIKQGKKHSIIIVADKKLKKHGRTLVHAISKTGNKVVLYTPEQYDNNETQISGTQRVIFLGKNKVSKDYIPLINEKFNKLGVVWGYDFSRAVIYNDDSEDFTKKQLLAELKKYIKDYNSSSGKGLVNKFGLPVILGTYMALFFGPLYFIPGFLLTYWLSRYEVEKLKIQLGILSFLQDGYDKFLEDKNE